MAEVLKATIKWESPDIPLEKIPKNTMIVNCSQNVEVPAESIFKNVTEAELGQVQEMQEDDESTRSSLDPKDESYQAIANLLMDTHFISQQGTDLATPPTSQGVLISPSGATMKVSSLLKDLQPQREKPSEDTSRRFAA